jgi:hypothetical protein
MIYELRRVWIKSYENLLLIDLSLLMFFYYQMKVFYSPLISLKYRSTNPWPFLNLWNIYSEQNEEVPKYLVIVFTPNGWLIIKHPPKSIKTSFLNVGLYIMLSGFISRCIILRICIFFKLYFSSYFINISWLICWQIYVENYKQSELKTRSKPTIFFTLGPIYNYENKRRKKYYFSP